jgi:uncharacterized membrane protein
VSHLDSPSSGWLLGGALAYLLGPLGVTAAFNVPLNNTLASAKPEEAGTAWPSYVSLWLFWNHLRTVLAVIATVLLAIGLSGLSPVRG